MTMLTIDELAELPIWKTEGLATRLDAGGYGAVYTLSPKHVAKIMHPQLTCFSEQMKTPTDIKKLPVEAIVFYEEGIKLLTHEHEIHQELFRAGIQVPKPEGIFNVYVPRRFYSKESSTVALPGIVSEKIYGISIFLCKKAMDQYCEQLEKARSYGFKAGHDTYQNILWDTEREKLYLIDFHHWVRK